MSAEIVFTKGDILTSDAEALVNTVNCVGVMGRGIALQFKNAFPDNFKAYEAACRHQELQPGRMLVFETGKLAPPRYIINFPTKRHWRGKSRMEDIESGLQALVETIQQRGIHSVALPPLGSGLGGLSWQEVRKRIEATLRALDDVVITVYEPDGTGAPRGMRHVRDVPEMTAGRAVLVELVDRYLAGLLDPFISLLEVHKLMYFMQESGEALRLQFKEAPFGPYAENLRHVLTRIDGHLISGYADGGDSPDKPLQLVPGAVGDARKFLDQAPATRARFDRVSALVDGFESPAGLELLATVHWVITRKHAATLDDTIAQIYRWGARKRQFTPRQIGLAVDTLATQAWIASLN